MAKTSEKLEAVDKPTEVKKELSTSEIQKLEKQSLCFRIREAIDKTLKDNQDLWKLYEQTRLEIKQLDDLNQCRKIPK